MVNSLELSIKIIKMNKLCVATAYKDYFESMKDVSDKVDAVLAQRKSCVTWPRAIQKLYEERKGKPKLRAYLSYIAYSMYGGDDEELACKIGAISELNNLHLYTHNYAIDGKRQDIFDNRQCVLIGGGEIFGSEVTQMICELPSMSSDTKIKILRMFAHGIAGTYQGQYMDNISLSVPLVTEKDFIEQYKIRCESLSGNMYGLSLWLGALAAPKATAADAKLMYSIGYTMGAGLQVVNDIGDFSYLKEDGFSDIEKFKPTAPIYYMAQVCELRKLSRKTPEELRRFLIDSGAFARSMKIAGEYKRIARALIKDLPACEERNRLRQCTSPMKTNRHLRNIKNV